MISFLPCQCVPDRGRQECGHRKKAGHRSTADCRRFSLLSHRSLSGNVGQKEVGDAAHAQMELGPDLGNRAARRLALRHDVASNPLMSRLRCTNRTFADGRIPCPSGNVWGFLLGRAGPSSGIRVRRLLVPEVRRKRPMVPGGVCCVLPLVTREARSGKRRAARLDRSGSLLLAQPPPFPRVP